jgi:hypothetical protein
MFGKFFTIFHFTWARFTGKLSREFLLHKNKSRQIH